jgi:hypothetical protein
MKKRSIVIRLILGVMLLTALAQMGPPTPAPKLQKLDYFGGNWSIEATIAPGPGQRRKIHFKGDRRVDEGEFFLVRHSDFSLPAEMGGAGRSLGVMGYDADNKVYTQQGFDSKGRHVVMTGTLNGDTWTWTGENNYGGTMIKSRLTPKITSPTSSTSKYEVSADGGATWMPFWEGKATKK